jgi:hypothetical protein
MPSQGREVPPGRLDLWEICNRLKKASVGDGREISPLPGICRFGDLERDQNRTNFHSNFKMQNNHFPIIFNFERTFE